MAAYASGVRPANGARPPAPEPRMDWAWFLDLDGTLLEIASSPSAVRVDPALPALLGALLRRTDGAVALVTGRSIDDAERLLPVGRLVIVGQHGLERRDANGRSAAPVVNAAALAAIRERLDDVSARHHGLVPEFKGRSVALHYRAAPRLAAYAHRLMRRLRDRYAPDLMLQRGKRVVELRPSGADKGDVIRDILGAPPFAGRLPVFIGDDVTDEAGFRAVNALGGTSIKVGRGPTEARHRLHDVPAVLDFLRRGLEGAR